MFALFVERPDGTRRFLATVDNDAWALVHGKVYSRERNASGETHETFRINRGQLSPE